MNLPFLWWVQEVYLNPVKAYVSLEKLSSSPGQLVTSVPKDMIPELKGQVGWVQGTFQPGEQQCTCFLFISEG
jgi:hypothetical protein